MERLFVAVYPPADVVVALASLQRKDRRGVRFARPESWHVTLRFLGDAWEADACEALDQARLEPARARLGPGVDLLGGRALIVPVDGLDALAATVTDCTAHIGEPPRRRFRGHLTIARIKADVQMPPTLGTMISAEFDVEEVALVRSRLDPQGARHETIRSWPVG